MKEEPLHVQFYNAIYEYFTIIVKAVNENDYETIKETIDEGADETYEEHIEALMASLKPKEETIQHTAEFLERYPEFTDIYYLKMVKRVIQSIETSTEKIKRDVYKKLVQYADELKEGRRANNGYDSDDPDVPESQYEDDEIHVKIRNADVVLKTHHDPLLIHLYSILFTTFSARYAHFQQ